MRALVHPLLAAAPVPYELPLAWRYITMFWFFLGFALSIGSAIVYSLVLRPALNARADQTADNATLRTRAALVMASAGLLFFLSLYPQVVGKAVRAKKGMTFGKGLEPSVLWAYLAKPGMGALPTGTAVLIQFVLYAIGALLLVALFVPAVRSKMTALAGTAAVILLLASVALGLSGDLSTESLNDWWQNKLPSYVHVSFACTWAGGLMTLALLGLARRRLSGDAGPTWAHIWKRFSRVAMVCVGCVICSGFWLAWDAVGEVPMLWQTPFGRFLMVKILLVLTLISFGAFNEFVLLPRLAKLRAADDRRGLFAVAVAHFPKVVVAEALIATGVLLIVPFLNGTGREEGGLPDSNVTGGTFTAAAILVVIVAVSFVTAAKVQGGFERRAAASATPVRAPQPDRQPDPA